MTIQPGDARPLGVTSRTECDLLIVGAGPEAATAVNNAAVLMRPDEQIFPGHSSDAPPLAASAAV